MKTLVACFSASGVTMDVAKRLAKAVDADLFEIAPTEPYTSADLDWTDKRSRSSVESNDPASRPEIAGMPDNLAEYDTVYIGFPIWWYTAPQIIKTFFEAGDFSGKRIVLFATSGGSGMGETQHDLKPFVPNAQWLDAKLLSSRVSDNELADWVASLS